MKKKYLGQSVLALLLAGAVASPVWASDKDVLLAKTDVKYKNETAKAELWGNKVTSGYAHDLMLMLKREDGSVITGYKPDINGGYGYTLKALQLKDKDSANEQLFLAVRQGDWQSYAEYRVLDIANPKEIKPLFSATDSFGVVVGASLNAKTLSVQTVKDKEPIKIELAPKMVEDISANRQKVEYGRIQSVTCLDVNHDGLQELITTQEIMVDKRVLADVGAVWHYVGPKEDAEPQDKAEEAAKDKAEELADLTSDEKEPAEKDEENLREGSLKDFLKAMGESLAELDKKTDENDADVTGEGTAAKAEPAVEKQEKAAEKAKAEKLWKQDNLTIMKSDLPNRKNSINKGAYFKGGMVYPVKMVAPNGEATYPQIMLNEDAELQNKLNKLLLDEADAYISAYLHGMADMAFNVIRADQKLLTVQLISGKDHFVHHNINILPGTDKKLKLNDILNTKDKNLVELINVLNTNAKVTWDAKLTDEWYIRNDTLYLMKNVAGTDEVTGIELNNLHKYIVDADFLVEKTAAKDEKGKDSKAEKADATKQNKK